MAQVQQEQDEHIAALVRQLHGTSGKSQGLFAMRKDFKMHRIMLDGYFKYFGKTLADDEELCTEQTTRDYTTMVRMFYNLATDFYEYGWCQSLHFCRFSHGEPFLQAIARMSFLDVGCGLGGPVREIAKFTDAHITGLNNSEYQIDKARRYVAQCGLEDKVSFATLHAPTLKAVYSGIYRVLKPGAVFGVHEWLLTEYFDHSDAEHRRLALDVQQGNGIAKLFTVQQGLAAMKAAGFEILHHEDLAQRPAVAAWWYPLSVSLWNARRKWDRFVTHYLTNLLEAWKVLPKGTNAVATSLSVAGDALVEAGEKDIFTPMYLMLGRKPAGRG
ncbi:S-adenosyl-L-methionine-dependent methyltransferase [Aspergillus venezuelensis]